MNIIKRLLSWILLSFLLISGFPMFTPAARATMSEVVTAESSTVPEILLPESKDLYEGYLDQLFFPDNSVSFLGETAKNQLGLLGQNLYDFLKSNLLAVSSGSVSSTVFSLSAEQISAWGGIISYEKTDTQSAQEAASAALSNFKQEFEVENVISALLHDCPSTLYWYDKVSGVIESGKFMLGENSCNIQSVDFKFAVVEDMQAENYSSTSPAFDTENIEPATDAANNAQTIVDNFANYSDYTKLLAYKDIICSLVSYNNSAASNGDFSTDADPWQLIYVFDGDSTTNVVCEGYSKAFQYLYDLSEFSSVDCITVLGELSGVGHMWNIVTIKGHNYLTDITNCDSGSIGANGDLFLAGASGDISSGYVVKGLTFTYHSSTLALWGSDASSRLDIAAAKYNPCETGHTEVIDPEVAATCNTSGLTEGSHCSICNTAIVAQDLVPATGEHNYVDTVCQNCGSIGGSCGETLIWEFDTATGNLTISGSGSMTDFSYSSTGSFVSIPWSGICEKIISVTIEDGVADIGNFAFYQCSNLTDVIIPESVTHIGERAFYECSSLENVCIPDGTVSIGSNAFAFCTKLSGIHISSTVTEIDATPFIGCINLEEITVSEYNPNFTVLDGVLYDKEMTTLMKYPARREETTYSIPSGVSSIACRAFEACEGLTSIFIPDSVMLIESGVFDGCTSLTQITVPDSVTYIDAYVFNNCSSLTDIKLPETLNMIGEFAFNGCTSLKNINIPQTVVYLCHSIFTDCTSLSDIRFYGDAPETISEDIFKNVTATVYYPVDNITWTTDVMLNYGGSITWKPYCKNEHTEVIDAAIAASCTEAGVTEGSHCSICGTVILAQQEIPASGHNYDMTVIPPTCTDAGYTSHVCNSCGDRYDDSATDAAGHNWLDATCASPKTCSSCGATEGITLEHSYSDAYDTTCDVCDHIRELNIVILPMYRLYNPYTQEHLLTSNQSEKDQLESIGWHFDGIAWNTPSEGTPVYRLYNPYDDWHTYSMSQEEIDCLTPLGWKVDGIVCYSVIGNTSTPIYRLFNPYAQINYHLLTASEEESSWLSSLGWILEGVGWYGI